MGPNPTTPLIDGRRDRPSAAGAKSSIATLASRASPVWRELVGLCIWRREHGWDF